MPARKRGSRRKPRRAKITVLIVGEGYTEVVFLEHLKSIYNVRNCGVSVTFRNAHGHGPENVINVAERHPGEFTKRAALLDTDLEWTTAVRTRARLKRIEMLPSKPCLEGLLLKIQGKPVPYRSDLCKSAFANSDLRAVTWYQKNLPRQLLERRRVSVLTLNRLIELVGCPK